VPIVFKYGSLNLLESSGPVQACIGTALPSHVGIDVFPLDAGLLARGQYSEGPATGHLHTGFSWFPRVFANAEMVPTTPSCHYMLLM
jgi:hypothetical protein